MIADAGILSHYFPGLSKIQLEQFEQLLPLYKDWNEKINVISRKDIERVYERHVLHSLGIAKVVTFGDGAKVLDAGTGGGFPGIPLAILFPQVQFHLVDSIGKKIKVVDEIVGCLNLKNVTTEKTRAEQVSQKFDFAVSRAVASLKEMVAWLRPLVIKGHQSSLENGMIFLKGGDLSEEIREIRYPVRIFNLKDFYKEEFFEEKKVLYIPFSALAK